MKKQAVLAPRPICRRRILLALLLALAIGWISCHPDEAAANSSEPDRQVILVGPNRAVKTLGAASKLAKAGALIQVDAGEYVGDVAVWTQDRLKLLATGGRVRLRAAGTSAEGKGIWVVRANNMLIDGFDFEGAAVADRNGAGIRFEKGSLHVRNCSFMHNEMGILTSNDPVAELEIENSEFAYNYRPDDHNHNLYVGRIARLSVKGSYFHHAHIGHLLKSRAAVNHIFYNRLTDEVGGTGSYELEFPDGGVAYVVGNIIGQSPQTGNPALIAFGAEGYKWQRNEIYLINNTLINPLRWDGVFLRVASGVNAIRAVNNLLVGRGSLESAGPGEYGNNFTASERDFVDSAAYDYRLRADSRLIGQARDPGKIHGQSLLPLNEYLHPRSTLSFDGSMHNPGAMR